MREEIDIVEEVLDGEVCNPTNDFRWEYTIHPEDHYGTRQPVRWLHIEIDDTWFTRVSRVQLERLWVMIREMQSLGRV